MVAAPTPDFVRVGAPISQDRRRQHPHGATREVRAETPRSKEKGIRLRMSLRISLELALNKTKSETAKSLPLCKIVSFAF